MSDVRPTLPAPGAGAAGMRALTTNERHHLDGLRAHVRSSGIDVSSPDAVGGFVHRVHASWAADRSPVPEGMVAALGVALGDLVVAHARGARWMMRTAGSGLTPAVVSTSGHAAVLPLDDIRARWDTGCAPGWGAGYVVAAAAHLSEPTDTPTFPTPRPSSETAPHGATPSLSLSSSPAPSSLPSRSASPAPSSLPSRSASPSSSPSSSPSALPATGLPAPSASTSSPDTPSPAAPAGTVGPPRTPADLPYPPSPSAQSLALRALEQLLDTVVTDPSAARPFAVVEAGGRAETEHFDDTPAARAWVRASGASCAAIAWVGTLPDDGAPAVLVEACDARRPSLRVAHQFSPARSAGAGRARPARPVGEPLVLGNGAPLL
jgi:hypothetical protein